RIGQVIQETVYGQPVIKAYGQEKALLQRFHRENEGIFRAAMAIIRRTTAITPFTEIVAAIGASGLIFYGARCVLQHEISTGFFFLFVAGLFSLISPLKTVGTSYASLRQASAALPRISSLLEEKAHTLDTGRKSFTGLFEVIRFHHVCFAYGSQQVLKDICLTIKRGQTIGLVGPTGAGKTTLAGLLLRFYEPASGQIFIDGTDIREFTLASLRRYLGLVTQEPILFSDTIAWNIAMEEKPEMERVKKVARAVGLAEMIEALPAGYETVLGERGTTLSGGQKQLLAVARALYRDPPILLLDEATASLDSQSEQVLQRALEQIMEGRTVLIIAHRLSTLRHVQRILVLKDGQIVEEGTHGELFEKRGVYHHLWTLQFLG
ncbi:MAG TPA: ABC transporter ATP-binding protein, partial [bacterium]|nr:ABC transporter ATP-binding protein [bacterium]